MGVLFGLIIATLAFAYGIDRRRKKINNTIQKGISPSDKPGESTNYTMGDNHYTGGGQ
ncbi:MULTISPECIES: hypothetical protein [Cytobacillus]|jgi:hypothetical protein|uniref:Uncharacterized protein n=1 Tax=Cytobacillus pseudoceanisediminis TaxID=3051614 RepID=A0ABZ2ZLP4_9BACI|nr:MULTISPECIES: hypothetical protein [Cytobacillus]EFV75630.1 hypothetical protein HMPREF1013_04125 [Bacillus sp. 2_A_57_CT2]MBU8730028.1 hypothetical protein [Cytobacillus oceanisediminis]MBY0155828.1 hypothetical protein [Cytobacillus firmus]MCM3241851.1 hypothetical protein [Cytobacillus oceanisediminis]MCM3390930.1 hypothetical protein [Cytobacillus oceanisediminis]